MMKPITIKFMLACYCSPEPAEHVGLEQWISPAGVEVRYWLGAQGLIDDNNRATERGEAWVRAICETPLPIPVWALPARPNGEAHPS